MVLQKGFHSIWSCYTSQPLEYRREYVIRSAKTVIYQNFLNIFCRTAFLWWVSKRSILSSWHFGLGICFNTRLIIRWFDQKWRLITLKPTNKTFPENWVSKQSFSVLILTMAQIFFFRDKTFLLFKIGTETFSICLNMNFVKPHKVSIQSDNQEKKCK